MPQPKKRNSPSQLFLINCQSRLPAGLYGFGFAFAGIVLLMREANTMVDVGSYLVQGFTGTTFPVKSLPYWLIPISLMLPLTYGLDAVRGLLLKTTTLLTIKIEIIILIAFMFIMLWMGAQFFYRVKRRVRTLGTLGSTRVRG